MAKFGQKKRVSDYIFSRVTIVVLLLVSGLLAHAVYERYIIEREMAERRAESEADYQALLDRKEALEDDVEYLTSERGIEEEMRSNFDLAGEGEQVIVLVGDSAEVNVQAETVEETTPWYLFWR